MMKWLYRQNETYIDGFDFKKLKRINDAGESIRSQTLTSEEYNKLIRAMHKLSPNTQSELKDLQLDWFSRGLVFFILSISKEFKFWNEYLLIGNMIS